ncbi:hypothetical protein ACQY0O_005619 [Thecaphora frezii]
MSPSGSTPTPAVELFSTSILSNHKVRSRHERYTSVFAIKKIPYIYHDLASDDDAKTRWRRKTKDPQLPGILVNNEWRGTFDEFEEAVEFGELQTFLGVSPQQVPNPTELTSIAPSVHPAQQATSANDPSLYPTIHLAPEGSGKRAELTADEFIASLGLTDDSLTEADADALIASIGTPEGIQAATTVKKAFTPSPEAAIKPLRLARMGKAPSSPSSSSSGGSTRSPSMARFSISQRSGKALAAEALALVNNRKTSGAVLREAVSQGKTLEEAMQQSQIKDIVSNDDLDHLFASLGLKGAELGDNEVDAFLEDGVIPDGLVSGGSRLMRSLTQADRSRNEAAAREMVQKVKENGFTNAKGEAAPVSEEAATGDAAAVPETSAEDDSGDAAASAAEPPTVEGPEAEEEEALAAAAKAQLDAASDAPSSAAADNTVPVVPPDASSEKGEAGADVVLDKDVVEPKPEGTTEDATEAKEDGGAAEDAKASSGQADITTDKAKAAEAETEELIPEKGEVVEVVEGDATAATEDADGTKATAAAKDATDVETTNAAVPTEATSDEAAAGTEPVASQSSAELAAKASELESAEAEPATAPVIVPEAVSLSAAAAAADLEVEAEAEAKAALSTSALGEEAAPPAVDTDEAPSLGERAAAVPSYISQIAATQPEKLEEAAATKATAPTIPTAAAEETSGELVAPTTDGSDSKEAAGAAAVDEDKEEATDGDAVVEVDRAKAVEPHVGVVEKNGAAGVAAVVAAAAAADVRDRGEAASVAIAARGDEPATPAVAAATKAKPEPATTVATLAAASSGTSGNGSTGPASGRPTSPPPTTANTADSSSSNQRKAPPSPLVIKPRKAIDVSRPTPATPPPILSPTSPTGKKAKLPSFRHFGFSRKEVPSTSQEEGRKRSHQKSISEILREADAILGENDDYLSDDLTDTVEDEGW